MSCEKGSAPDYTDQDGTFIGRWPSMPVPVATYAPDFSADEREVIARAATAWNSFYNRSHGFALINIGTEAASVTTTVKERPLSPSLACSSDAITSGLHYTDKVGIYKNTDWPYGPDVIALTTNCSLSGKGGLGQFHMAVIEVNARDFFASDKRQPDFQTIMTHEFGHLAGLGHACEDGRAGYPSCAQNGYGKAVMAAAFAFPDGKTGEVRRELSPNDQGRANCLYDAQTKN